MLSPSNGVLVSEDRWLPVEAKWSEVPSARYRAQARRKPAAYERPIQIGLIVQGLLQYLAVFHHRAVWRLFGSWLRTENRALAPSGLVVAHALRNSISDSHSHFSDEQTF